MQQQRSLVFLIVVLVVLLPVLLQIAWPFFTSFILASAIAIVMNPANEWLSARVHRTGLATPLTTLATVSVLSVILAIAGFTLARELTAAHNELNKRSLEEGGWPALVTATVDRGVDALDTRLPVSKESIRTEIIHRLKAASGYVLSGASAAVGGVKMVAITIVLVTIFVYFLPRQGQEWLVGIQVCWCSVPRALGRGRRPGFRGSGRRLLLEGLVLGLWGALVVGSVDNVMRPTVVGARERNPMLIALAAIGGTYAFGALGILLGPLIVSLTAVLLKEIQMLAAARAVPNEAVVPQAGKPGERRDTGEL